VQWGEDVVEWDPERAFCACCCAQGAFCTETAAHFVCCPKWDQLWVATAGLLQRAGCIETPARRDFLLYGPTVLASRVADRRRPLLLLIWATAVATMLEARQADRRADVPDKPVRQAVNELHARLRGECRTDLVVAMGWQPRTTGTAQVAQYQTATPKQWAHRWRGLAQRWKGRVRWHTDASFDYDQAALDVDALDEELDEKGDEQGCAELLGAGAGSGGAEGAYEK
jgi:hypothetical protein